MKRYLALAPLLLFSSVDAAVPHDSCVNPAVGVPLYADARLYAEHGVPIVMYGAGPRTIEEANAKRPDENLLLEDLRRATHVVASTVHDLLREEPARR